MTFMRGPAPIRRTLKYLNNTKLFLKPFIRIVSINYDQKAVNHKGIRDFVFWNLPQLQYKNPTVQINSFLDITPTPFFRVFTDAGREILLDVDRHTITEIHSRILKTLCKSEEELKEEKLAEEILKSQNPAHFGFGCPRHCICEIPGHVPCPGVVPLPYHIRGKYKHGFSEINESLYA